MNKKRIVYFTACVLLIAGIVISVLPHFRHTSDMSYLTFLHHMEENEIKQIHIDKNSDYITAVLHTDPDTSWKILHPGSDDFLETLLLRDITVTYSSGALLPPYLSIPLVLLIIAGIFCLRFGKKQGIRFKNANDKPQNTYTLKDVAGNTEAKAMVQDMISFLKNPEKYSAIGADMPRGMLFYGPPGTGKTLMAKAIAGEAGVPFYTASGSDFVQMYVGVGASRVRELFRSARKAQKAVIFIDEIDAIGKRRSPGLSASNDERDQTLNALLTEMSGFQESEGILVIAATNRAELLDEALIRPGRFDRQLEIGLPDLAAREKILNLYLAQKPVAEDISVPALAKDTVSFSGAMLKTLVNEAAILAANEEHVFIMKKHIDQAFYTCLAGAPKQNKEQILPKDRALTAYHEAGHALMTRLLLPEHIVSRVTILPSTKGAGGFSLSIPPESMFARKSEILANIKVLLAGRASEELVYGTDAVTTGASNDLEKASSLLYDYIAKYGMDEEYGLFAPVENRVEASLLETLCRSRMHILYKDTKQELCCRFALLEKLADNLLEQETLYTEDLDYILQQ